jgi:PKHD-type hydroxylase
VYKNIYNDPRERSQNTYSWVYWDQAFTDEELDQITQYCLSKGAEPSTIMGTSNQEEVERVRVSQTHFHHRDNNTAWIFDRFNDIIMRLNERFYGFNLNGYDSFQYTEYDSSKLGRYDWHMDTQLGANTLIETRKLSLVLNLSKPEEDYRGGSFQLNLGMEEEAETVPFPRGRIIAFPSFMIHRVTPVVEGIRRSIVVWVTGPKFI